MITEHYCVGVRELQTQYMQAPPYWYHRNDFANRISETARVILVLWTKDQHATSLFQFNGSFTSQTYSLQAT